MRRLAGEELGVKIEYARYHLNPGIQTKNRAVTTHKSPLENPPPKPSGGSFSKSLLVRHSKKFPERKKVTCPCWRSGETPARNRSWPCSQWGEGNHFGETIKEDAIQPRWFGRL